VLQCVVAWKKCYFGVFRIQPRALSYATESPGESAVHSRLPLHTSEFNTRSMSIPVHQSAQLDFNILLTFHVCQRKSNTRARLTVHIFHADQTFSSALNLPQSYKHHERNPLPPSQTKQNTPIPSSRTSLDPQPPNYQLPTTTHNRLSLPTAIWRIPPPYPRNSPNHPSSTNPIYQPNIPIRTNTTQASKQTETAPITLPFSLYFKLGSDKHNEPVSFKDGHESPSHRYVTGRIGYCLALPYRTLVGHAVLCSPSSALFPFPPSTIYQTHHKHQNPSISSSTDSPKLDVHLVFYST